MTLICGVEEAGRGPVIGPLVMAAVVIDKADETKLVSLGVKDSKLLSPKQRVDLYKQIIKIAKAYEIVIIDAAEIDGREENNLNLNELEAVKSAELINLLKAEEVYVDCPSNNIMAYKNFLKKHLVKKIKIIAEHKADLNYPVVAAASILAKVTRDKEITKLKQKLGIDFGSGYPADPKTKDFLAKNWNKHKGLFRESWATWKAHNNKKNQKNLSDY